MNHNLFKQRVDMPNICNWIKTGDAFETSCQHTVVIIDATPGEAFSGVYPYCSKEIEVSNEQ